MPKHSPDIKDTILQSNYEALFPNIRGRKKEQIDLRPKIIFQCKLREGKQGFLSLFSKFQPLEQSPAHGRLSAAPVK